MEIVFAAAAAATGLTVAGVELTKRTGLRSRWAPFAALVWGQIIAWLLAWAALLDLTTRRPAEVLLTGLVAAFAASGVYSQAKTVATASVVLLLPVAAGLALAA